MINLLFVSLYMFTFCIYRLMLVYKRPSYPGVTPAEWFVYFHVFDLFIFCNASFIDCVVHQVFNDTHRINQIVLTMCTDSRCLIKNAFKYTTTGKHHHKSDSNDDDSRR